MISNDTSIKLYQAISEKNEARVFKYWHASSVAECPRAHYFMRLGIESLNKPSGSMILRWGAGHNMEKAIRPYIEALYPDVESNNRLTSKKLDLTGEYDNLSGTTLVEIKSVHDYAFIDRGGVTSLKEQVGNHANGNKKWDVKTSPYLHHELQQHAYVLLLAEQGIEVTDIDYVYCSLSGRLVVYKTKVNPSYLENVKKRLEVLNEAWKTKTPPDCICHPSHPLYDGVMQYCNYKTDNDCCNLNLIKEEV